MLINGGAYIRGPIQPELIEIDCLQSAFSRKIRLVLISASAIANQTLCYTPSIIAASSAWVSRAVTYYCNLLLIN